MKTRLTAIVMAVLISVNLGYSQTPASPAYSEASQRGEPKKRFATFEQKVESAKKNYMVGLCSENTGLVESTIKNVAKTKLQLPSTDITELQAKLDELSVSHPSAGVRYKAYIASSICSDPEWYAQEISLVSKDQNEFFIAAAHRLQQKVFGQQVVKLNSF